MNMTKKKWSARSSCRDTS